MLSGPRVSPGERESLQKFMLYERVLVTGANGLLGRELVGLLSRFSEYDVLATGRSATIRSEGSYGYMPLDITARRDMQRTLRDFEPTVVINCAAMTNVDRCETDREACWKVNVEAVETLAQQCSDAGARLIQLSTDFVFNGLNGPYEENARPDPVNFYGKSKQAAENAARRAGFDKWTIARTVLVYGTGAHTDRSDFVLWLLDRLSTGQSVQIVTDQWRTPTCVADLAGGIERIVRRGRGGIFHLSGAEWMSMYDFARTIADVFGLDSTLIRPVDASTFRQTADRPAKTGFIILKAQMELDYHPRPVREALRKIGARLGLA